MNRHLRLAAYRSVALDADRTGVSQITSEAIALTLGMNAPQVRRDLSRLARSGLFGKRGVGYQPQRLVDAIGGELDTDEIRSALEAKVRLQHAVLGRILEQEFSAT